MLLSITTVCYNTLPIIKKCVGSVFKNTTVDFEYILVNNHPPYEGLAEYLDDLKNNHSNVTIIDPGENVGCHNGYNLAFAQAEGDYIVKLDDDTVLPDDKEWAQKMIKAFDKVPDLAYLSTDVEANVKIPRRTVVKDYGDGIILEEPSGEDFVGTSCAMFPRKTIDLFGPFQGRGLYGWEELHYSKQAKKYNLKIAHFPPIKIVHLGRTEESDPAYGLWKFEYGYGVTTDSLEKWQQERDISNYGQFVMDVLKWGCYSETQAKEIYDYLKKIQKKDEQKAVEKRKDALKLVFYVDGTALQNCAVYRCFQPAKMLEEKGLAHSEFFITFDEEPPDADLYIFQRQRFPYSFQAMMFLKERGKRVVYEIDDQLFMISPRSQAYPHFSDPEVRYYMEHSVRNADAVTVTTEELKNQLLVYNKNIYVIPNYIDSRYWQVEKDNSPLGKGEHRGVSPSPPFNKDNPSSPPFNKGGQGGLIIGWGGTATHYDDLELIKGVLESIVDEFNFVKIGFIGYDPGFFKIPEERKIFYQWQSEHQAYV
ncbi:MAG: glycosyltransferase, partial [Actinobacteria bacterium]|nr:glycosyltransferase [Actinomycetota bacterium]